MSLIKCLKHAFGMVVHSKLRSWLTIIGIVIGVAAVIAIMSIGGGKRETMNQQLGGLGGDILSSSAGYSRGMKIMRMFRSPDERGFGGGTTATEEEPVLDRKLALLEDFWELFSAQFFPEHCPR